MWRLVLTVALWNTISSQPVTDDAHNSRPPRQIDFVECCPCPVSGRAGLPDLASAAGADGFSRSAALDDCPCRLRDPDPQGSPSLFISRAVRPSRPVVTLDDQKEDVKPLLKPEVGLASSVLETLREVTDEEYQEALHRDAARNAARVAELGEALPGAAKNVLTIIVNPVEDFATDATPEASQPSESRCIPPFEANNLGQVRGIEKSSTFRLKPKLLDKKLTDMNSGASNVQERVTSLSKSLEGLRLKTTPSVLKLFPARKSERGNIQSLLKLKSNKLPKEVEDNPNKLDSTLKSKLPSLKVPSLFKKDNGSISVRPLDLAIKEWKIPKIRTSLARKPNIKISGSDDNKPSQSVIQNQFSEPIPTKRTTLFNLKSLMPSHDKNNTPLSLSNLLNLKDVELLPQKSPKLALPDLKLLPHLRVNKPVTDYIQELKTSTQRLNAKDCTTVTKGKSEESNFQSKEDIHTQILDTVPQASEDNPLIIENDIARTDNTNLITETENIKTEILDALPSASDNDNMIVIDKNGINTSTPSVDVESVNSDEDLLPQTFEEPVTEQTSKLSKDNFEIEESNDGEIMNSIELTIDEDDNSNFEGIKIVREIDEPISEIDISGTSLDLEELGVDLEANEDSTNAVSPTFTFSSDFNEPIIMEDENQDPNGFQLEIEPEVESDGDEDSVSIDDFFRQRNQEEYENQEAVAETSNQNIQVAIQGTEERSILSDDSLKGEDIFQPQELGSKVVPKADLLSSIKEKITLKLKTGTSRAPYAKFTTVSGPSKSDGSAINVAENQKSSLSSDEFTEIEPLTKDSDKFLVDEKSAEIVTSEMHQVNMQDLQQMSDSLLRKSERIHINLEDITTEPTEAQVKGSSMLDSTQTEKEMSIAKSNFDKGNEKANSDLDSSATSFLENFEGNMASQEGFVGRVEMADAASVDNTCASNLQLDTSVSSEKIEKSAFPNAGESEMVSGASETVFNTMPKLKSSVRGPSPVLQQSIVVQPTSLLPPLLPLDLSTVNIPTLDDIRLGISNLLAGNARTAVDEKIPIFDAVDDCSDTNPIMSSDASTTNTKSAFPQSRPLQDINLDIFQMNPLSQGSPFASKMPSLNLNSFRTKLALPKSFDLKPMKLESALGGKNGGLLGATLTFGPDKTTSSRHSKPVTRLGSILNRQGYDILGNRLFNMPNLEELRSKMKANTKSLLRSPLASPLDDTLRTTEAFGNSLRSHTENTMRNIQQSLSSTLSEARVTNNPVGKYAKPEDLLEKVSSAHEDMKDKLYGIHVDLQDRLTSLHESILDNTKLQVPELQSPLLSGLGRLQENFNRPKKAYEQSSRTPQPKLIVKKKMSSARVNKPIPKTKEQNKVKPYKMSKAAGSLIPKTVEVPKLIVTSSKPPFLHPLSRDASVILKESKSIFTNEQRENPVKTKFNPFGVQAKVSISTTPQPASFRTRPTTRPQLSAKSIPISTEQPTSLRANLRPVGQFRSSSDTRSFASESPLKALAPVTSGPSAKVLQQKSLSLSSPTGSFSEFALSNPLKPRTPILKPLEFPIRLSSSKSTPSHLSMPKPTESPLVSKMREAIRIRLSRPIHQEKLTKAKPRGEDMTNSASETKGVVIKTEPMKENVSYKCKMVCVRE